MTFRWLTLISVCLGLVSETMGQGCQTTSWVEFLNMHVDGGVRTSAGDADVATCQSQCLLLLNCLGVDYTTSGACWLVVNPDTAITADTTSTHYWAQRVCTNEGVTCTYRAYGQYEFMGSIYATNGAATLDDCYGLCAFLATCNSFAWDPVNQLCISSDQTEATKVASATYTMLSRYGDCTGTCGALYVMDYPDSHSAGGARAPQGDASIYACQNECIRVADSGCIGIDYTTTPECYTHLNPDAPITSETGTTHQRFLRDCTVGTNTCNFTYLGNFVPSTALSTSAGTDLNTCASGCMADVTCTAFAFDAGTAAGKCTTTTDAGPAKTASTANVMYERGACTNDVTTVATTPTTTTTTTTTTPAPTTTVDTATTIVTTAVTTPDYPEIYQVQPQFGPIAGGTKLTIVGQGFVASDVEVYLGKFQMCTIIERNVTAVFAETPQVMTKENNAGLTVVVELNGRYNISSGISFDYKANPEVTSIYPLSTITEGGTTLTVTGNEFNSVAEAILKLTTIVTVKQNQDVIREENVYFGPCESTNRTILQCITPALDLDEEFTNPNVTTRRRRAADREASLTIYIGLLFDGLPDYVNISANEQLEQYGKITVDDTPFFEFQSFVFSPNTNIGIQGNQLRNIPISDYLVQVGTKECKIVHVTDDVIQCLPPQEAPVQVTGNDEDHQIFVNVGHNVRKVVGSISYEDNTTMYIIVGTVLGGMVLIVCITGVILLVYKKAKISKEGPKDQQPADNHDQIINLPPVPIEA